MIWKSWRSVIFFFFFFFVSQEIREPLVHCGPPDKPSPVDRIPLEERKRGTGDEGLTSSLNPGGSPAVDREEGLFQGMATSAPISKNSPLEVPLWGAPWLRPTPGLPLGSWGPGRSTGAAPGPCSLLVSVAPSLLVPGSLGPIGFTRWICPSLPTAPQAQEHPQPIL